MANRILKPEVITATALGLLERDLILANLVWTDGEWDFSGAKNDTVTIRVPARLKAREYEWRNNRSESIVMDEVKEHRVDIRLSKDIYSAVAVTDEELTLDISNFGSQILQPQTRAVAEAIDDNIAALIENAPYRTTLPFNGDDPYVSVVAARKALNRAKVPRGGRWLLVGSDVEERILLSERFSKAASAGEEAAVSALQEATVGRIAGFTVVQSEAIDPGHAFAFVQSAYAVATRAPVVPDGAKAGSRDSYHGFAMRWIQDYDSDRLRDRSVVSAFAGFNVVTDPMGDPNDDDPPMELVRAVKLELADPPAPAPATSRRSSK
ncbi:P22 phage major capsid protein family protein [Streptomyces sp. DSM 44915]|uniref:P22 phage major capsid protein family protein n=1 Tax=Streptomyces chisholmiae TaxID=3075540 RepID=A0ABU2JUU6_9ACTN|nr:P22 phage major capsid protein family protein [Streptomyces sp. DSM 44915]MDT0267983.1 P22 phage major capsid protein family protein [Streptomyces sp. DSM 44915]